MRIIRIALLGVAFGLVSSPAALAVHGQVGTWEIRTTMLDGGPTDVNWFCMSLADVASDKPPMSLRGLCRPSNQSMPGDVFHSEVVCRNPAAGHGTVDITFSSPTHYSGHQSVTIRVGGREITNKITFDGRWLSSDCEALPMVRP
jgi:hypothetical protein